MEYLEQSGLEVKCQEIDSNRKNVIGILRGTGGDRSLILNGHNDTVSLDGMEIEPLEPVYRNGKIYGRDSLDMKEGLAAIILAVKALIQGGARLKGDVILVFVADEEYTSKGTEALVKEFRTGSVVRLFLSLSS
jgi:acetylornithine deacetylase